MSAHTETQIIRQNGRPAFAVIPFEEYELLRPALERERALRSGVPHAVARRIISENIHPVRAWREHLGIDQSAVAGRAGMKPSMLSRIEAGAGGQTRVSTLKRIAGAMGLTLAQIDI